MGNPYGELALDEHLDDLQRRIVEPIGFDPADLRDKLLPPRTKARRVPEEDYKVYTVSWAGLAKIRVGATAYRSLQDLTRTTATYFVATDPSANERPSSYWPAARDAFAATACWYASPSDQPRHHHIAVGPRQQVPGQAFSQYAFRFVLCHELAHVALDTIPAMGGMSVETDIGTLRASQDDELDADAFGLRLQVLSLPDLNQLVTAVTAPVYYVFLLRVFNEFRLALLANLVDYKAWTIEYTHPPFLHRCAKLAAAAQVICEEQGVSSEQVFNGIDNVRTELEDVMVQVLEAALAQRDRVTEKTSHLLRTSNDKTAARLSSLLNDNPLGVLQALDSDTERRWADKKWAPRTSLPPSFLEFLKANKAKRVKLVP